MAKKKNAHCIKDREKQRKNQKVPEARYIFQVTVAKTKQTQQTAPLFHIIHDIFPALIKGIPTHLICYLLAKRL